MSFPKQSHILFADTGSRDAFNRGRISTPYGIFDSKAVYPDSNLVWNIKTNGISTVEHTPDKSCYEMSIGTNQNDYAIKQTGRYFAYVPGKSQLIMMTGTFNEPKNNLVQRIGYFDDNDGLFFQTQNNIISVVKRTSISNATEPEDHVYVRNNWNIDKFDGNGPSGIDIDFSKAIIFVIDFQWLGVGRIRFGFSVGGTIYYCHEITNINELLTPYMATPSLPCRYEIRNIGTTYSPSTLISICQNVSSEGGYTPSVNEFAVSNGTNVRTISTRTPILAVRLKSSYGNKQNRRH